MTSAVHDDVATGVRRLVEEELAVAGVTSGDAAVAALASLGLLDCERPEAVGGLGLGLAAGIEVFVALGRLGVDSTPAQAVVAALDALAGVPDHGDVVAALRSGALPCAFGEPASSDHAGLLAGPDGTVRLVGTTVDESAREPAGWHARRCLRSAAFLAGAADGAYQHAVRQARERQVGGAPLLAKQLVADRLVRTLADVRVAWSACHAAARAHDAGRLVDDAGPAALRLAGATAGAATRGLVQLGGARALTDLSPAWSWHRLVQVELERTREWR